MRSLFVAACLSVALLHGCGSTSGGTAPSLTITPSGTAGTVSITGPTDFTAQLVGSSAEVTWAVTGGTLTSMTGLHVVYMPPLGSAMATLTATAGNLTAMVTVMSSPSVLSAKRIPGLTAQVTVQYDAQDVPHIQCSQAADCVAVQGYLQARDRLFPMDFLRHVAEGQLSQLIGPAGLTQDLTLRTMFLTRDGKKLEEALGEAVASDAKTLALLTAFTSGVNAYLSELKTSNGALPGEYAQLPFALTPGDIQPWRIQDTLAIGRFNQFQLSETATGETANGAFALTYGPGAPHMDLGRMAAWIRAAAPTSEQAHTLAPTGSHVSTSVAHPSHASVAPVRSPSPRRDLARWRGPLAAFAATAAELRDRLRPADASLGSNNWVVSGQMSATGAAMVANDPHLPLQYPPLFHLAALTSSNSNDHLDLNGGSFCGVPGALVGRGQHVGWGVTVVGYDVTDVYMETFPDVKDCPDAAQGIPCVTTKRNNVSVNVSVRVVPTNGLFMVRTGPGPAGLVDALSPSLAGKLPVTIPPVLLVVPHHGPVIQAPAKLGPPDGLGGPGLSVRWTGHEGTTLDTKAFYGLNTASDVDAAMTALNDYATGAQNFVLADDQGNIAYYPHALVPVRNFPADALHLPWFPLPGDGSAEWGDGTLASDNSPVCAGPNAAQIASCWIPNKDLPQGKNPSKGYFFTANADPTTLGPANPEKGVSDDNNPLVHQPYLSFDWDDSSGFRATRIEQMMKDALARSGGKVSLDDMMKIQSDHVSRIGLAFAPSIAAAPDIGAPELAAAKAIIATWIGNGADCPSGLTSTDPKLSAADTTPAVVQNSSGCFLFHAFLRTLVTNVFTDDLALVTQQVHVLQQVNGLSAIKAMLFMLGLDPADPNTPAATTFCKDIDPKSGATLVPKTCPMQVSAALVQAYKTLHSLVGADPSTWVWGRVHTIQPVSLLPLVTSGYSPGPFARPGGAFTVDVGSPSLTGGGLAFGYGSGGNVRHISLMDPAKPVVKMQLPGPERDGPVVASTPALLDQWVRNSYFDYAASGQISAVAVATQTFQAP